MENNKLTIKPKLRGDDAHKIFSIRIPEKLCNELDNVCYKCNMFRNELIRICIEYALENLEYK